MAEVQIDDRHQQRLLNAEYERLAVLMDNLGVEAEKERDNFLLADPQDKNGTARVRDNHINAYRWAAKVIRAEKK